MLIILDLGNRPANGKAMVKAEPWPSARLGEELGPSDEIVGRGGLKLFIEANAAV